MRADKNVQLIKPTRNAGRRLVKTKNLEALFWETYYLCNDEIDNREDLIKDEDIEWNDEQKNWIEETEKQYQC